MMTYLKLSAFSLSALLPLGVFAASYTTVSSGDPLNWADASTWLADGAAASSAPTASDRINNTASVKVNIYLDGETGYALNGNYGGQGGVMDIKNGAVWNMGYAYTMGGQQWVYNINTGSTVSGFFAVASASDTVVNLDGATLNGNFEAWANNAVGTINVSNNAAFNGSFRFNSGDNTTINANFKDAVYTGKSVSYLGATRATSTLNLAFDGSGNTVSFSSLDIHAGLITFVADSGGVTLLEADSLVFDAGVALKVDFSNAVLVDKTTNIDLISSSATDLSAYAGMDIDFVYKNSGDSAKLLYNDASNSLYVEYTSAIPEPSSCAALLGLLALALAAYRRGK